MLFHACDVQKPIISLGSSFSRYTGTLFFPDRIQTQHSQTQLHMEGSLLGVKVIPMVPLVTAGVSDDVAREMTTGPQALEDVEEPTPSRPATLKDLGTPDQLLLDQQSDTFPKSALVQSVGRIPRTRLSTLRTRADRGTRTTITPKKNRRASKIFQCFPTKE